jgi:hypothetical protein
MGSTPWRLVLSRPGLHELKFLRAATHLSHRQSPAARYRLPAQFRFAGYRAPRHAPRRRGNVPDKKKRVLHHVSHFDVHLIIVLVVLTDSKRHA